MARPSHLQYTVKNSPQGGTYLEDDDIHGTGFCIHPAVSTNLQSKFICCIHLCWHNKNEPLAFSHNKIIIILFPPMKELMG